MMLHRNKKKDYKLAFNSKRNEDGILKEVYAYGCLTEAEPPEFSFYKDFGEFDTEERSEMEKLIPMVVGGIKQNREYMKMNKKMVGIKRCF